MKREELIAKGYSEEQVTEILNMVHGNDENFKKQISSLQNENKKYSDENATYKSQLDEINKANMSEQEKLEQMKRDTEKNLRDSKIIVNKAKATEILAGLGLNEKVINKLVTDDENETLENANTLLSDIKAMRDNIVKETQESLLKRDTKPSGSNDPNNDNGEMTKEKFYKLSYEEKLEFKRSNPEEYENLK